MNLSQLPSAPSLGGMALYRLHEPAVIAQVLQEMVQQQAVFSLYAQPDGVLQAEAADLEAVLGLARIASVELPSRAMVWQLPKALGPLPQQLWAIAQLPGGVRVQCPLQGAWTAQDGMQVLRMDWPAELLQLQRRRHQRFPVPLGQNYTARFGLGQRRCVLDLDDLSPAGLALRGSRAEAAMLFMGRKLPRVQLQLAEHGSIQVSLQVRSRRSYRSFLLGEQVLVGCTMEGLSDDAMHRLQHLLASGMQLPRAQMLSPDRQTP